MPAGGVPSGLAASGRRRAEAAELRKIGWSINDIAVRMGIAKSTAFAWVRHVPPDPGSERARMKHELAKLRIAARWDAFREERDRHRADVRAAAMGEVGGLSDRDTLLLGAVVYQCGGVKPDRFVFTGDDPDLLLLVLKFLHLHGYGPGDLSYRVNIRDAADAEAAADWWARVLGIPRERFRNAAVRRHVPGGGHHHGRLAVTAPRSRELCWRIEGVVAAIAGEASSAYRLRPEDR
ncbi:helix-turn-helix domain-containing protein [Actinoplanes sp. NPDC023801]|uniref:helix-turn-helix domain-containing protein n=1 Tax=Actinoplanes sp. NPDC023801 TaxID=3154595 RepID=UPI0033FE9E3D